MQDQVSKQLGLGLKAMYRPAVALLCFSAVSPPRFDMLAQSDILELIDASGYPLTVELPNQQIAKQVHDKQSYFKGALVEVRRESEGLRWRLLSLYHGDPIDVWDVTLTYMPRPLDEAGRLQNLKNRVFRRFRKPVAPAKKSNVVLCVDKVLELLADSVCIQPAEERKKQLVQQAEALGLSRFANGLSKIDQDSTETFARG